MSDNKEIPDPIAEMDKAVRCLSLELPATVWNDVNKKWQALKESVGPAAARYHQSPVVGLKTAKEILQSDDDFLESISEIEQALIVERMELYADQFRQPQVTVKEAIDVLIKAIKEDAGYYYGWQSNIAIVFCDEYNKWKELRGIYEIANNAAKRFLNGLGNISEPASPVAERDEIELCKEIITLKATVWDYEEMVEDHKRLVRELDVIINGLNAAKQASLCDLVSQMRAEYREWQSGPTPSHEGKDAVSEMNDFFKWWRKEGYHWDGEMFSENTGHDDFEVYTPGELYNLYTESLKQQK